jgi:hypothetical protein
MSGDVKIAAEIAFSTRGNPHRKAVLPIRQSLDADSFTLISLRHGNGMTAPVPYGKSRPHARSATPELSSAAAH